MQVANRPFLSRMVSWSPQDLLHPRHHSLGEGAVRRHAHVPHPAVLVVELDDLRQVCPHEGLAPGGQQEQQLPQALRHLVDLVQGELEGLALGPLLEEEIEAVAAAQVAHLGDEVDQVDGHGVLLEKDLPAMPKRLQSVAQAHSRVSSGVAAAEARAAPVDKR
jgi:hypothetical protein